MFKRFFKRLRTERYWSGLLVWLVCSQNHAAGSPPQQALAELRGLHLPAPISWWPLAYGWYAVMGLLLILLIVIMFYLARRFTHARPKRQALQLLTSYQQQYGRDRNLQQACARVSELLKRVALVYFPREKTASLKGEEWLQFLNKTGRGVDFSAVHDALIKWPYYPVTDASNHHTNMNLLFKNAREWIAQRRKPCGN